MPLRAFRSLTFLALLGLVPSLAAALTWETDLEAARKRAAAASARTLVFFSSPAAPLSVHFEQVLADPEVQRELASGFVAVRLDFLERQDLARRLHVFKAGTVTIYAADGAPLARIEEKLSPGGLIHILKANVSASNQTSAPPPPAPASLARGRLIAGPVKAPLNSDDPILLGRLEKGKTYLLAVEGVGSIWGARTEGIDGLYIYNRPLGGGIRLSSLLRFGDKLVPLGKFLGTVGVQAPAYSTSHAYELRIPGDGKPLRVTLKDGDPRSQSDNSGALNFTLFEAASSPPR